MWLYLAVLALMLGGCAAKDWTLQRQQPVQIIVHVHIESCPHEPAPPPYRKAKH
jgi:hypothetical protein